MVESANSTIEQHPDIAAMRAGSEAALTNPAAQAAEGPALLTGLYIAASPWIVGFGLSTNLAITNLIVGPAFMVMLVDFGSAFERTHGMSWAAVGIGVWTVIAPWAVVGPPAAGGTVVSNVVAGALAALLALFITSLGMGKSPSRFGSRG
ncbi:membrane protein [Streptomonospora alba]|uniref:Membrane protein n=1 Tax=Streptomonospora alba TaxID=183763 RepID=A0A0C2JCP6_9ACTN|nr:SPW repeat protein [Streptomonospora alba]KIH99191.1 membrane protein [Streptomonospora alba]